MVAQCTGLRISEILGLQWGDFDFEAHTFMVQRSSVVSGRVDAVKTEYSKRTTFRSIRVLKDCCWNGGPSVHIPAMQIGSSPIRRPESPSTRKASRSINSTGSPNSSACRTGSGGTFRHTYRSWLDETGAPMKVQQELMRHASIQTTMNIYGRAMNDSKRKANSQVVGLVFGETLDMRKGT
jgi:integrase